MKRRRTESPCLERHSRRLSFVVAVWLAACGADGKVPPPDLSLDGGGDPASCGPGCPADSVCVDGACQALPTSCPCPLESYCDLASNSCKVGCLEDGQCAKGRYCDTATRSCRPGCRGDAECASPDSGTAHCKAHACVTTCNTGHHLCGAVCADNGAVATCGSACTPCPTPDHATPSCDGKACGYTCSAGWADCNGQAADGCERASTPVLCYQDKDGDGFGNQAVKQTFDCGSCPTGWTAKSDVFDCYDDNKDVFPGQTQFFCKPYTASNYDYDCDGKTTLQDGQYARAGSGPCYISFPMSMRCGETRSLPICLPGNYEDFTRCCR